MYLEAKGVMNTMSDGCCVHFRCSRPDYTPSRLCPGV